MAKSASDKQLLEVRRRLRNAALAALSALVVGTGGYMILGRGTHGFIDALYMTVISLTTVGYGEVIPLDHHPWGRVFTMFLLVFGLGILAYFASTLTVFIFEGHLGQVFWRQRMHKAIGELKEHIIVCGDRIVAAHVIDELRRVQRPVVSVIPAGSALHPLATEGELLQVEGDPADEETLREAGVMRAAGLVSAMESDRENVLVTLTARQTNPIMRIVSMLVEVKNDAKLRRAGADAVVNTSMIGGLRVASEMIRPGVVTFLDSMLRDRDKNLRIDEITIHTGSPAIGQPLGTLRVNEMPGLLLLAYVAANGKDRHFKPADALLVEENSTLVVMGGPDSVSGLRERYGGHHALALKQTAETPLPRHA
jgi:voltage-gated potassium channel